MKTRYLVKRKGDKDAPLQIWIALYERDAAELIFTGQRISKAAWSTTDREPKNQEGEVFKEITKVMGAVNKAKDRLKAAELPITPYTVKTEYARWKKECETNQSTKEETEKRGSKTVFKLVEFYRDNQRDELRKTTQKTVKSSIDQFLDFLDKAGLRSLQIKEFSDDLIIKYGRFLLEKKQLADSTYNVRMKHLKWFLKSIKFNASIVNRKLAKRIIIALTVPELKALETIDVAKIDLAKYSDVATHEYLQRAKDLFLLGCYTALRISDLKRINPVNTNGGFISLTTQKSNEVFKMPLMNQAQVILNKYQGWAPKISEQEVNRSIKIVCKEAGLNTPIEIEFTKGGKKLFKYVKKYEVISSHIAGKTFITNAKELWGLDPAEIAAIVRKDLKTMLNSYFRAPVETATKKMLEADMKAQMKIA